MRKFLKISALLAVILLVGGFAGFYFWSQFTYDGTDQLETLVPIDEIDVVDNWLVLTPEEKAEGGIVLYPGAKVEPAAYRYYAQGLADAGYLVVIPQMTFNFAIFNQNIAEDVMEQYPEIKNWYVEGHSLGGVAASGFAYTHQEEISGVILLGSYPADSTDFSDTDIPMLSLFAEHDGLTTPEKIKETKSLLSTDVLLHQIEGGNHAGFGMYGSQKGDKNATISVKDQQDEMIKTTTAWLKKYDKE
ncbi:alpha/beta hydrolase [Peribacillus sp. FSL H8-0477]|uniref:alpha/beta hydrolase n=1 Tax=Peribacillus sp. FSL H8-0477 TaxID=2921388 RepID=UPI0030F54B60